MSSPVIRWQIVTPEPARVADFYGRVFGWNITQDNSLGYREVSTHGGIDGGIWPAPPGQQGFVQLFVEVPDIDACLTAATAAGASVLIPRTVLPDGDVMALLLDPTGVSVGVCSTGRRSA